MPVCSAMPVLGLSAIQSRTFRILFGEYERGLVRTGYHPKVVRLHLHSIAHLGVWIEREGRSLKPLDEETLEVFGRHRPTCTCPGTSRNRARQVLSCVRRFVQHLRERGIVQLVEAPRQPVRLVGGSSSGCASTAASSRARWPRTEAMWGTSSASSGTTRELRTTMALAGQTSVKNLERDLVFRVD